MTENQSSVFPENLQQINLDEIVDKFAEATNRLRQAINHDPSLLVDDEPEVLEMPKGQSFAEFREELNRKPEYQLIHIGSDLANVAALLHVAYKSSAFEDEDYQEEIFKKSIGSGGDQVLIEKILGLVSKCYEKVDSLRSQLESGEE